MKNYSTTLPCTACGVVGEGMTCLHHIKTRGSGGTDDDWNLISLCQQHHNEIHSRGLSYMADGYTHIKIWLINNGWVFEDIGFKGKWIHPETFTQ